jgi:parvulin-like peptidyl-prolyl isomerase
MDCRFVVLLAGFVAWCSANAQAPPTPPAADVAATVNGEPISIAELDSALNATLPATPLTAAQRKKLRAALLEDLIDERVLRQFLVRSAPKVEPAEVDAQMTALKARLVKENLTLDGFLKRTGQTEAQLREEWAAQIRLANHVKRIATDDKLRAYHAANRDHFDKVEVRVSHILVRVGKDAPAVERAAAREKLEALRREVAAGRLAFAAAAKKYSQCASGLTGGDLGFIPRRGLPEDEPLAKAAFGLKVGELSEVAETARGYHLLTVTDRKPGVPSELEKCIVEVLEAYAEDVRTELIANLRKEAKIQVLLP